MNPLQNENKENIQRVKQNCNENNIYFSEGAGLYMKMPWHSVHKIDRRTRIWETGAPEQIGTGDKTYIVIDVSASYSVTDPLTYFQRSRAGEHQVNSRLDTIIDSNVRNKISLNPLIDIVRNDNRHMESIDEELELEINQGSKVTAGREKIASSIIEESKLGCEEYGLTLGTNGLFITNVGYVEDVKTNIENRMSSERLRVAERYKAEGESEYNRIFGEKDLEVSRVLSDSRKRAGEIKGRADKEATEIYVKGYSETDQETETVKNYKGYGVDPDFFNFWKTLDLYKTGLSGDSTSLYLGTGNPLFDILEGKNIPNGKKKE